MDRYPVVILDRPIRIFDFKPIPLLCLIAASLVALKLSSFIDPHFYVGNIPANVFTFICAFSLIAGHIKALELKPIKWWLKRLKYVREPLPLFLPESELSSTLVGNGSNCSCLKISNQDLANLDDIQRLKVADLIVDFANDQVGSLQIYSPPSWAQSNPEQRDFYLITKENSRLSKLANRIGKYGLGVEATPTIDVRRMLYAQLSPSHLEPDLHATNSINSGSDLLSLCVAGFEHKPRYVLIDGKYVSTIHLTSLPLEVNFGLLDKLLDSDCDLSFSMYLRPCNMPALKRQARFRLNCELSTAERYKELKTPANHLAHFRAFCESEMAATGIGISATIYADSLNALEYQMMRAQKAVHRMGGTINTSYAEELEAMISGLPICEDMVAVSHTITSQAAAKFIPFL
ncbi:hypothetical protein KBI23_00910 [bacterium]|jgi:hypothetical protein|nr:hypothetical protein [bacterium]MBP9808934.1 hypothetical protein [bacterium]